MKRFIMIILSALLLSGCGVNTSVTDTANKYDRYSVEEKVGQLFFVRCDDGNMDNILSKNPGGILMFGVDFKDLTQQEVKNKIKGYQKKSKTELIIGVDEEGGTVVRVSSNPNLAKEKYKSPQDYYALGGMELIAEIAKEKAQLLKDLGINMNLAPVADVSENPADFIYDRSFGKNADMTAEYVKTEAENSEINLCLKHFPGYGDNVDTHTGIAIDNRSKDSFYNNDFIPFEAGIEQGVQAVLVSHNIVKAFDADLPASVSPEVHRILREDLGFTGLIMTDDMAMEAMADYGNPYTKAILAGNDLIIVSDFETGYNEVLNDVKNGTIPMEIIDRAFERIMYWKEENL